MKYTLLLFSRISISIKKGFEIKKGIFIIGAALIAALFLYATPTFAFKNDFLYKFQSRWSDVAVNALGTRIFIINDSYSRIEEYASDGTLTSIHGGFGTGNTQFNRPQGLVMDSSDNLYVLDTGNNRVVKYDASASNFTFSSTWGSAGTGGGQFNNPNGIATDNTYLYIADTDNNRVQKCALDGTSCDVWGSMGTGDGYYSSPKGIWYDSSVTEVYVADTGNNRIQTFDTSGVLQSQFGSYGAGNGQFILPYRITSEKASSNHYIYVIDTLNRVQRFLQADKSWTGTITLTSSGSGIKTIGSVLYVATLPTTLQQYTTDTLTLSSTMTNDIGHPVDMALDTSGNIYINNNFTTPNEPVIQKFNSSFIQQAEWTGGGGGFGHGSSGPLGIGINTGNDLFVADTENNRIQKFTSAGSFIYSLTPAPTPGAFSSPKDVATETTGKFYVADTGNGRIVKFGSDGTFTWATALATPTPGGPTPFPGSVPAPYGITVGSDNKIYVADAGYARIQRFDANGNYEASWGMFGSADNSAIPQLDNPEGMAFGPEPTGFIYVADTGNNRIQRFDQSGTLGTRVVWGTYGTQDGNFINPRNVVVDSSSRVFVSEVGDVVNLVPRNRRIQVFGDATASAGLTITQTSGTTISEGTSSATMTIDNYTVKLNTQPSTTVTVNLTVSDPTEASVTTPSLVFTPDDWNIPQVVTVVPTHDFIANGTHSVVISHKPTSTDVHYQNLAQTSWSDVTVTINDTIDTPEIIFSTNTISLATEGATLANAYTIGLNTKPTGNVTVKLTPDGVSNITADGSMQVNPPSVTFTPTSGDWNTPRQVHILPIHDFIAEGTHSGIISHTAVSTDPNYNSPTVTFSQSSGNVAVTISDIDVAGISLSKTSVSVNENGTTDTYRVNLTSKPTQEVDIFIQDASPSALVTLSPSTLTFLPGTWSSLSPQTVTVTAIHDSLVNPINPRSTNITNDANSGDDTYNGMSATVSATITDSDSGGLLVFRPGGGTVSVTEGGATDEYAMQLTSIPLDDVTVTMTSPDGNATTSAYFYTFTPSNWNTPQLATVSAVNDLISQGTHYGAIKHTLASTDTNFDGKITYETATITDNDTPGIDITLPNGVINIAEAGPSDSYSVKLSSQPTSDVTLNFSAQSQATASPLNLTFTPGDWNVDQEIAITAIQDFIIEGPTTATVTYTGVSTDTNYNGLTASFVANIADDDSVSPGVSIVETNGGTSVTQGSDPDTYTLVLTSKPTANVKIKIVADSSIATTSAGVYWFTPSVWNVPQTVYVSAKTNPSSSQTTVFSHLVTSLDAHYDGIGAPTVNVTVNPQANTASAANARPPSCNSTPPSEIPNLFQITTTQTEATLYFSPIKDDISYYFIAYGFSPGDVRFGTSFQMGPASGVINYTVSMLAPATQYYFIVRGGNGCATGDWSQTVAATTVDPSKSAQTTRTFYAPVVPISTSGSGGSQGSYTFTRDLYPGSQGADVQALQRYLNAKGFVLASSGVGSPGNETTYYGNLTAAAVRRFQEFHFQEILSPLGYSSGTGIFGPSTRGYVNSHP